MHPTRNFNSAALAIAGVLFINGCATNGTAISENTETKPAAKPAAPEYAVKSTEHGVASWYSIRTNRGTRTASGQRLCNHAFTAAHKTLPMGTKVRVTNQANGKSEIVTINDRGPYIRGRIIDVTVGSAERLGFRHRGLTPVKVEVLGHAQTGS
jgi:rare lipoprotein A